MSLFNNAIIGASGQGGYRISRSVRLRSSASAYLSRTLTTPTNNKIWTWSGWIKRGKPGGSSASGMHLFGTGSASTDAASTQIQFDGENLLLTGYATNWLKSNAVYRDPSAWYHIVVAWDNSNATVANRAKIYVNGIEISYSIDNRASLSTSSTYGINQAVLHTIGAWSWNNGTFAQPEYYDGYLTEINFIDGQALTPSSFGETNSVTGVWQPKKYGGTYGTNGFYLNFSDNSNNTATTIGKDYSGNGNNWTPNNISVTAGVTYDSMLDVPTPYADGGNGRGNYCVGNPLSRYTTNTYNFTNANLDVELLDASNAQIQTRMSMGVSSGKWYWEATLISFTTYQPSLGVAADNILNGYYVGGTALQWGMYGFNGDKYNSGTFTAYGSAATTNDIVQIALDMDNGKIWWGKNGTWFASGNPAAGTNAAFTNLAGNTVLPAMGVGGAVNAGGKYAFNFGQRPFTYTPPTGFVALNTQNLPTPTISNGAGYMAATTYTGTGASLTIANTVGSTSFQPDLVWVKGRSGATDHALYDSVRGTTKDLVSNSTAAETTQSTGLTAFGSTGFTVGALAKMNTSSATYVAWQWQAGQGSTSSNTSGSITSTVSVNATAGFSVVTWTSTGANATVGHGLGVAPKMVIIKGRSVVSQWFTWHTSLTSGAYALILNLTDAQLSYPTVFNSTTPTSSVFSVGTSLTNGTTAVAYCFAEVAGYSKFGSYTGNGSSDGPFVYCGFRPRWILFKANVAGAYWTILDTARNTYNVVNNGLWPNDSGAETSIYAAVDVTANGFKIRSGSSADNINYSGSTTIFAAFAENPFKYSLAR